MSENINFQALAHVLSPLFEPISIITFLGLLTDMRLLKIFSDILVYHCLCGYTSECVSCTSVISYKPDCPAPVCVSRLGVEGTLLFSGVVDVAVKSFFWEVRSVSGCPVVTNGQDIVGGIVRRSVGLVEEP